MRKGSEFFEWEIVAGPMKGHQARVLTQSIQQPDYADIEFRHGKIVRGPYRVPWDWLKFVGPR